MPSTLTSTGITFSDGTNQNSAAGAGTFPKVSKTFVNSGNHTFQSNTKYVEFRAAGGGGGQGANNVVVGGGGGGGFAVAVIDKSNVFPNTNTIAVNVAAGGGTSQNGGSTSIGGYVVANGGNTGTGSTNSGGGGNGGTGAVNITALFSQTGTGGAGRGGNWNESSRNGFSAANFGGGGGGLSASQGSGNNVFIGNSGLSCIPMMEGADLLSQGGSATRSPYPSEGRTSSTGGRGQAHIIEYAE